MKSIFLFLAILFLAGAVFLERSEQVLPLEAHFIRFLAKVTHRKPPSVTAVKMPLVESHLSPEDVALAFRAIVSFHPHEIFVLDPVGDFFRGPFSLLREAVEQGELQGVPIHFMTSEPVTFKKNGIASHVHLISLDDLLLRREERERGSIFPELDAFFVGQTVLLGGPQVAERASHFLNQAEKKLMLPAGIEFIFLLLLFLLMMKWVQLPWIDFCLMLLGILFCLVAIDACLFQARNAVFSLIAPCVILVILLINKLLSCTSNLKK